MINNIVTLLDIVKKDTENLGDLSKIALGKNKLPITIKEAIELVKYR